MTFVEFVQWKITQDAPMLTQEEADHEATLQYGDLCPRRQGYITDPVYMTLHAWRREWKATQ